MRKSVLTAGKVVLGLLLTTVIAVPLWACCDPETKPGDCYTCVDGAWVDQCGDDETCCTDSGSYCCGSDQSCCEGDCCDPGECCDNGECVTPDTNWTTTGSWSVNVPSGIKDKVNQAINSIPGVSGVTVTEGALSATAKQRECCDPPIKHQKCCDGTLTLSADLGEIEIYGGSFERDLTTENWGVRVTIAAHVFVHGDVSATATAGDYIDECDSGCVYGSASMTASPGVTAEVGGEACVVLWGLEACVCAEASGDATISFTGSVWLNGCGNCNGSGGEIKLNSIILSGSFTVLSVSKDYEYTIYEDP